MQPRASCSSLSPTLSLKYIKLKYSYLLSLSSSARNKNQPHALRDNTVKFGSWSSEHFTDNCCTLNSITDRQDNPSVAQQIASCSFLVIQFRQDCISMSTLKPVLNRQSSENEPPWCCRRKNYGGQRYNRINL